MRRRTETLSSSICCEVLVTLERMFALEGPDEPDLGLNVSYLSSCRALSRLALAEPWEVPGQTADAIRRALARIEEMRDPHQLERQLLTFPVWVLQVLDRRRADRSTSTGPGLHRRFGDRRLALSQGSGA
jgi:hypothetical protein